MFQRFDVNTKGTDLAQDLAPWSQSFQAERNSRQDSKVEVRPLVLDLQSFDSVRAAAKEVIAQTEHIDVLVNNAGVMAPPYSKTIDGFESTFQTNHLSHFLFTNLIMEKLMSAPEPRVVVVSSDGYRLGHVRYNDYNFHDGESYNPCLTRRDIEVGAPQAWAGLDVIGEDQGIATHVFAAFSPEVKEFNGGYLEKLQQVPFPDESIYPWAIGELEQRRCWKLSEELVGRVFKY
ncbi:uncharacterized protein MYCGRDRAFT_95098 [Zymoseptoria tritici IPO323]|uniref:Short-chain dehydrogenase/reductase n=1 Tax=Zymoseptoria tritici (strain CBS 115943 / IPO323) TaxID=336722 RepID=F9XHG3_ZYMTI|nr:uncharacterized protein MYCGRDRAFT_95098 [Zymoseptoria tritici IPO323]EGP84975.1 hypothetical protein MYCGRDRAFT_95098 [Zymoseptoria tritici IPO323]